MMKFTRLICLAVCALGISSAVAGTSNLRGITFEGRQLPVAVFEDSILSTSQEKRFVPASLAFQARFAAPVPMPPMFGLFVPGDPVTTVTINGTLVETDPIRRSDGAVYMVGSEDLIAEDNHLIIYGANGAKRSWAGTTLFSITDTFEQYHFNQAFWDGPTDAMRQAMMAADVQPTPDQDNYDALWYDCNWKPSTSNATLLAGTNVTMGGRSLVNGLQVVSLDFDFNESAGDGLNVDSIDSGPGTPTLTYTSSTGSNGDYINVNLPVPVPAGQEFVVRVHYSGRPVTTFPKQIFGTIPYNRGTHGSNPTKATVYTASQPYGGRRWWPSKDHPSDKATTTIQRITVPTNLGYDMSAVSNGVLESVTSNGDSTDTWVWKNDLPIATYLVTMNVSNFIYTGSTYTSQDTLTTMPVGQYIYPERLATHGSAHIGTIDGLNLFSNLFGEYPFIDQKYASVHWNISFAIEHQTATAMPSASNNENTLNNSGYTNRNIHELSHHWFGDKITCADWDHTWLNEGFATYCVGLFIEAYPGALGLQTYTEYMLSLGASATTPVVGPNSDTFANATVYAKGAWIPHMLRHVLGDAKFFAACRHYLSNGYTTAVTQSPGQPVSFQEEMEESAGLTTGTLTPFFTQWLYGFDGGVHASRPTYSYGATYQPLLNRLDLQLRQTQAGTAFTMPVDVKLTNIDGNTTTIVIQNNQKTAAYQLPLGTFVPVSVVVDPDSWILKNIAASIQTLALPGAAVGQFYSQPLSGVTGFSGLSWSLQPGSPAWVSVSSSGQVTGTPPVAGEYVINVRVTDSTGASSDASVRLVAGNPPPLPKVVINELMYEVQSAGDAGEFVELFNTDNAPANVGGWQVVLVGSNGNALSTSVIPGGTTLAPGDYYVLGNAAVINAAHGAVVDQDTGWSESISDGSPAGIVLKSNTGLRVDSLAYRADAPLGGTEGANAMAEGGTGRGLSRPIGTALNATLNRLPNGTDTNSNLMDFAMAPATPGSANTSGVTLPFTDSFDGGIVRPEWRYAYQAIRTATPGTAGKPPVAAPESGGAALEVYDSTGGGDTAYLPGAFERLNFEGHLWIPQNITNGWSTGVGIGTRVESAWFSNSGFQALEHGFYLEYQSSATGMSLKNGQMPNNVRRLRLLAVNGTGSIGSNVAATSIIELGSVAVPASSWVKFRLALDTPGNLLKAEADGQIIYSGAIPAGPYPTSGGIVVGFREEHSGQPSSANAEGTWVDNILLNTNTSAASTVVDFQIY